jgi:hypothetical protein
MVFCGKPVSVNVADPVVTEYLATLTERAQAVLGDNLVGVYAAGSIALEAYEGGRSDIDVAIVVDAALERSTKQAVIDALRTESLPCPARGLELVVYRGEIAAAGGSDPDFEVELNSGPQMAFRATFAGSDRSTEDGTFWYAIDRSILAERGLALTGPDAADVFRSVSEGDLVTLLAVSLRWHLAMSAGGSGTANGSESSGTSAQESDEPAAWTDDAVLNACRAWRRVRSGHWYSKVDAGRQVLREPATPANVTAVVRQALDARAGGSSPSVRQARDFQRFVLAEIQSA